jgi:phosphoserine phosphatase
MEGSSAFQFGRAAHKAGLLSGRQLLADAWANVRFRLRGSTDEDSHALRDRISASLAGARERDLSRLGPDVLVRILPRVYPQMLGLAYEHQDIGRPVYIATAASQELASVGQPSGLSIYGAGKARAIEELAEREGIDLAASYAYSDSASDLPMLRAVGHPVAVNPDSELAKVAREEGWEVLRFERLGRRLKAAAALTGAAVAGGAGSAALVARGRGRGGPATMRPLRRVSWRRMARGRR